MKQLLLLSLLKIILTAQDQVEDEFDDQFIPPPDDDASMAHPLTKTYIEDSFCMDGSKAAAYMFRGSSDDLILYFYSGGICVEDSSKFKKFGDYVYIDSCEARKKTFYGTSNGYPDEFNANQGIMGNNKYQNEHLRTANKLFLMYCDGNMWYSQMNPKAFESALKQFDIKPKRIILSGSGIGGWYLINKHTELLEVIVNVYGGLVDVRLLLDSVIFDISRNEDILQAYTEATEKAGITINDIFSFEPIKKIQIPTFIVHSQYDWWQLEITDGFECIGKVHLDKCTPKEKKQIERIRLSLLKELLDIMKSKPDWGLWAVSCVFNEMIIWTEVWNHPRYQIPMSEGGRLADNFQAWLNDTSGNNVHYDIVPWPDNKPCSNIFHGGKVDPQLDDIISDYEIKESRRQREEKYDL